ncbi:27187_t:CDS:1, partial [Gigaspora margarita]
RKILASFYETWGVRKDFREEWMSSGTGHLDLTTVGIDCSSEGKSVVV